MKQLLFVDDEPKVLQGLQRQLYPMRSEWGMQFVGSGERALEKLADGPVDVVVTDMIMPGMDGAQLLAEVMKRHPNTVRIVLSGHADDEAVMRLVGPAHQYLSKPCNPEELRGAITRALAIRDLLSTPRLKQLASSIPGLRSLPKFHEQLTAELRKDQPCVRRIAQICAQDLGMAPKILQLVNSSFFGLAQPITNVDDAVMYLGLSTIRALVLSNHVFSQFDTATVQQFSLDQLMKHCWRTASLARSIAVLEHADAKTIDYCFTAGLVHDLGCLILASSLPGPYGQLLATAQQTGRPRWELEQETFGATHAQIGAYLLGIWGLPTPITEAVALHHCPEAASERGFSTVIAVHVADAFDHQLEIPNVNNRASCLPPTNQSPINTHFLAQVGLAARFEQWKDHCVNNNSSNQHDDAH